MRVICVSSNFLELVDRNVIERLRKYLHISDGYLPIKKGESYTVYGVLFRDNSPWYYLCHDEHDASPTPYPCELFQTTDERLSAHWRLCSRVVAGAVSSAMVFREWAMDSDYFENLTEGSPQAISLFMAYKAAMDAEFPNNRDGG